MALAILNSQKINFARHGDIRNRRVVPVKMHQTKVWCDLKTSKTGIALATETRLLGDTGVTFFPGQIPESPEFQNLHIFGSNANRPNGRQRRSIQIPWIMFYP